jgi:hypothetical protein
MKKIVVACAVIVAFVSVCFADGKANWKKLEVGVAPVATGEAIPVRYLTGLPEIDATTPCYAYNVKLVFDAKDLVLKRHMIDQEKGKGLVDVEVARMKYADIKDVLFGYDAVYALQENKLSTAQQMICGNQKLLLLMQRMKSPVAIIMNAGGKQVSLVVVAPNRDALALYRGLGARTKVKLQTPLAYKGIVKERAKLDAPPPESER